MSNETEVNVLKDSIASWRKEYEDLSMKNQGVRPSWVSTDLSLLDHRISAAVARIKELEGLAKFHKGAYTKGDKVEKKRKLGLIFFKPSGIAPYMITKRLQVLHTITGKVENVWFAKTLNTVAKTDYLLENGQPRIAYGWTFGWQVEGDVLEAIKND